MVSVISGHRHLQPQKACGMSVCCSHCPRRQAGVCGTDCLTPLAARCAWMGGQVLG